MMNEVLRTVAAVAGIGGIALVVLLYFFRDVVRKNIFPKLTKAQGSRLLTLMVIIIGGIVFLSIIVYMLTELFKSQATPTGVGVVSLSVEGDTRPSENVGYYRCPNEVQVIGSITSEGKGTVTYAFVHYLSPAGNEELGPTSTIYFDGPQKAITVRDKFPLSFSEGRHYYEVYLQVLYPVDQRSEPVYITVECGDVPPDPVDFGFETPAIPPPP